MKTSDEDLDYKKLYEKRGREIQGLEETIAAYRSAINDYRYELKICNKIIEEREKQKTWLRILTVSSLLLLILYILDLSI